MPCELLGAAQVAPWAPLGHPRGSKGSPRVSLGALSMARERSGGILGVARPAKSSVCIVNNVSNADPRNSIPALPVAQNSSADSADSPDPGHGLLLGTPLTHAPGARMT